MPMRRAPLAAVSRLAAIARFDLGLGNLHVVVRAGTLCAYTLPVCAHTYNQRLAEALPMQACACAMAK